VNSFCDYIDQEAFSTLVVEDLGEDGNSYGEGIMTISNGTISMSLEKGHRYYQIRRVVCEVR
jgi:hypothetical protein